MTLRTRLSILIVLALGWFTLAVVNLTLGHVVVALAYAMCGGVISVLTLKLSKGRRAR